MDGKTLIQFAVAISIIGILIAFVGPTMFGGMAEMEEKSTSIKYDNYSLELDGTDGNVTIQDDDTLNPDNITISMWFKINSSTGQDHEQFFIQKNKQYWVYTKDDGDVIVDFYNSNVSGKWLKAENKNYNDGKWHNVIGTSNQTNMTIYMDGNYIKGISDFSGLYSGNNETLYLGANPMSSVDNTDNYSIDSVQMYSDRIDGSEASYLYNHRYSTVDKNLSAYYPCDSGEGSMLNDHSDNDNDGDMYKVEWDEYKTYHTISESVSDLLGLIPIMVAIFIIIVFAGIILKVI